MIQPIDLKNISDDSLHEQLNAPLAAAALLPKEWRIVDGAHRIELTHANGFVFVIDKLHPPAEIVLAISAIERELSGRFAIRAELEHRFNEATRRAASARRSEAKAAR